MRDRPHPLKAFRGITKTPLSGFPTAAKGFLVGLFIGAEVGTPVGYFLGVTYMFFFHRAHVESDGFPLGVILGLIIAAAHVLVGWVVYDFSPSRSLLLIFLIIGALAGSSRPDLVPSLRNHAGVY